MFPHFIKHYDMIRSILRDVFLYGCFSKSDLENKNNNSSRKISYEIRRIRQYIESDFIKVDKDGKNKLLNLSYDSITNTRNFLVDTYLSKSFTKSDIVLYYYLLLVLNYTNKPMTFSEIEDTLINEALINYDEISSKTIERKVNLLKEENNKYYTVLNNRDSLPVKVRFSKIEKMWLKGLLEDKRVQGLL